MKTNVYPRQQLKITSELTVGSGNTSQTTPRRDRTTPHWFRRDGERWRLAAWRCSSWEIDSRRLVVVKRRRGRTACPVEVRQVAGSKGLLRRGAVTLFREGVSRGSRCRAVREQTAVQGVVEGIWRLSKRKGVDGRGCKAGGHALGMAVEWSWDLRVAQGRSRPEGRLDGGVKRGAGFRVSAEGLKGSLRSRGLCWEGGWSLMICVRVGAAKHARVKQKREAALLGFIAKLYIGKGSRARVRRGGERVETCASVRLEAED